MHHAGQPQVLNIGSATGDFGRDIDARQRFAHHLERHRILQLRFRLRLHMQHADRDQFAVAQPLSVGRNHRTVFSAQIFSRQTETPRGFREQKFTRLRGRVLNRGAAVLHGMAAGGVLFVGGQVRIGCDDFERFKSNVQLLSRDLLEGRLESLAEFGLAGEHRDAAVGIDANPGIQKRRLLQAAREARRRSRGGRALILREG